MNRRNKRRLEFYLLFLFILLFWCYPVIAGDDSASKSIRTLKDENRLLAIELELAQKGVPYIILDVPNERMFLKNRGVLLREFKIGSTELWGRKGLSIEALSLIKKKSYTSPKRKEITPHKQDEGPDTAAKEEFLELKDMPYQYTLLFEKGLSISVRGKPEGRLSKFKNLILSMIRHIYHSFVFVQNYLRKKDYTMVEMIMDKEEAQAVYWAFGEGTNIVILGEQRHGTI